MTNEKPENKILKGNDYLVALNEKPDPNRPQLWWCESTSLSRPYIIYPDRSAEHCWHDVWRASNSLWYTKDKDQLEFIANI